MNTREIIIDAAFSIFETTPFEKVTIQQIADKAHVSRKTFYNHFKDKYELMHLYYTHYVDVNVNAQFTGNNWRETEVKVFEFIMDKGSFFRNVYYTAGQDSFWDFLKRYSFDFIRNIRLHNTKKTDLDETEKDTILFLVEGSIALCKEVVSGRSTLSPAEMTDLIYELVPDSYRRYLDIPEEY